MDQIRERVLKVCSSYDKVTADKVCLPVVVMLDSMISEAWVTVCTLLQCQGPAHTQTYYRTCIVGA